MTAADGLEVRAVGWRQVKEQNLFRSEELAREFARRLAGMSPDLMFKIEPMPIQHVWN